jgi:hypothetical protein
MPNTSPASVPAAFPILRLGTVDTPYGRAEVKITRYPAGGALAVFLECEDGEPLATFSVNLGPYGVRTARDEFCAKTYSENAELVQPLIDSGWFEVTARTVASGFTQVPIWRLRDAGLMEQLH